MKGLHFILIVFFLVSVTPVVVNAQIYEEAAREELERKGITEEEVRKKLLERGIDLDNINVNDPNLLLDIEKEINDVIAEIERDKLANLPPEPVIRDESIIIPDTLSTEEDTAVSEEVMPDKSAPGEDYVSSDIYGHNVFRNKSLKLFNLSDNVKPADTYILGVGDEIGISIWGYSQESQRYTIGKDGYITPYKMEPIYLSGLTYAESRQLLEKRFQQYYRFKSNEFKATVANARDLSINIYGEVENPGSYNISAQNSAFNALVAAGGPSEIGSVRNIKLLKAGQAPIQIDVYEYLQNPSLDKNYSLEENDIIHVPVASRIIEVEGAVIREAKYELSDGEELVELFEFTGGFKANAVLHNIQVKRFIDGDEKIFDVNFTELLESNGNFKILNGDYIFVNQIIQTYENYVNILGAVSIPGRYAISQNTYLEDVLDKVYVLPTALTEIAFIKRYNTDDKSARYEFFNLEDLLSGKAKRTILLKPRDEVVINYQSKFADNQVFNISGAVRDPGEYQIDGSGSITVSKAIFLAGGLRLDASDYAYVKRKRFNSNNQIEYIRIDFEEGFENGDQDILLKNGDDVVVYSSITEDEDVFVSIEGAVRKPGRFVFDRTLTLRDVISMSGGFTIAAAPYKVDVYRLSFDDKKKSRVQAAHLSLDPNFENDEDNKFALNPFDQIYVREAPEFELQKTVSVFGEVKYKGKYPILQDNENITDIVERAGGLTDEAFAKGTTLYRMQDSLGYIVIDLEKALNNKNSHFNLNLLDGDIITIPKTSNIVTIIGETRAQDLGNGEITNNGRIHAPYEKGKNADYYIDKYAGGIGENGSKALITVTFPTGDVKTSGRFLFFKKSPEVRAGSVIKIGNKKTEEYKKKQESETDWGRVLTDSVAQATAILSLVLLVKSLD